ncbi:MAG TPA: Rrf2 family transcriptional regulator [Ignavibacteriaceae bacterium]|jgi:Rrf2 family protein|nr:Rrf2 family transcriptional regulator [Ignavibacteriaceae bacterium]
MKFSAQEEYGLRCLLRIAGSKSPNGLTIPEISTVEGLTQANTAKILRILRLNGFIESARGQSGGYKLSKPPGSIIIGDVLEALGGKLFEISFCTDYKGTEIVCTNSIDCSIRSLWRAVQISVDSVLKKTTLKDLLGNEEQVSEFVSLMLEHNN